MEVVSAPLSQMQHRADSSIYCALLLNDERIVYLNRRARELFGLSIKIPALHPSDLSPEYQPCGSQSRLLSKAHIEKVIQQGRHSFNWVHHTFKGRLFQCQVRLEFISDTWVICEFSNISFLDESLEIQLNKAEDKLSSYTLLHQHKRAIDQSAIVSKTDLNGVITYVNNRFCEVSGYSRHELLGKKHNIINHPKTPRKLFTQLWQSISSGQIWRGVIRNRSKDGSSYYVSTTICPIFGINNQITEYISIRFDLTPLYDLKRLALIQSTDQETRLANMTRLQTDASTITEGSILVLDFPVLADIAQVYPNNAYQELLRSLVQLTKRFWRIKSSRVYRVTDTQFALSLPYVNRSKKLISRAHMFADQLTAHEFLIDGDALFLSVKIGITEADGSLEAIKQAQICVNSMPNYGLPVAYYSEDGAQRQQLLQTIEWTGKINQALKEDNVTFVCQGIHNRQGDYTSREVLMRLRDPDNGKLIPPHAFLHHAKQAKVYDKLSRRLIATVFAAMANNQQAFSINLEMDDIYSPVTSAFLFEMISRYQLAHRLTVELIESAELDFNDSRVGDFIQQLKRLGCRIAIDDFGSGYSNFTYLATLPVDVVKIDGSLIRDITTNDRKLEIVKSIVDLCQRLQIITVAEFVSNQEIFDLLHEIGVNRFQGYWFSTPMPLQHLPQLETL